MWPPLSVAPISDWSDEKGAEAPRQLRIAEPHVWGLLVLFVALEVVRAYETFQMCLVPSEQLRLESLLTLMGLLVDSRDRGTLQREIEAGIASSGSWKPRARRLAALRRAAGDPNEDAETLRLLEELLVRESAQRDNRMAEKLLAHVRGRRGGAVPAAAQGGGGDDSTELPNAALLLLWTLLYAVPRVARKLSRAQDRIEQARKRVQTIRGITASVERLREGRAGDLVSGRRYRVLTRTPLRSGEHRLRLQDVVSEDRFDAECADGSLRAGAQFGVLRVYRSPFSAGAAVIAADVDLGDRLLRRGESVGVQATSDPDELLLTVSGRCRYPFRRQGGVFGLHWSPRGTPVGAESPATVQGLKSGVAELSGGQRISNPRLRRVPIRLVSEGFLERRERLRGLLLDDRDVSDLVAETAGREAAFGREARATVDQVREVMRSEQDRRAVRMQLRRLRG